MMVVDNPFQGSGSKKRKRAGPSKKEAVFVVPVKSGPRMRDGRFVSGQGSSVVKDPGFVDVASATYALDTTGSITLLNIVPQGTSNSERVGKRIMLKSLQFRGQQATGATATSTETAYIIVYDRRPCGNLPAITDVLDTINPRSFNNDTNSARFKILKRVDRVLIGSVANTLTTSSNFNEDWFLSLKGLAQVFNAAGTGAIGDIDEGAIYLITIGATVAGTAAGLLVGGFRTRYLD